MKNDGWKLEDCRFPFGMVSDHKQTVKLPGSNPLHKKQARNTTTDGTCSSVNFSTFLGVPKDMRKKGCEESLEKQCKNFHACVFLSPEVVHCFPLCVFGYLVVYGILDGYKLTLYKNFLTKPLSKKTHGLFWRVLEESKIITLKTSKNRFEKQKCVHSFLTFLELPPKYIHQNKRKQQNILWKPREYWVKCTYK